MATLVSIPCGTVVALEDAGDQVRVHLKMLSSEQALNFTFDKKDGDRTVPLPTIGSKVFVSWEAG